MKQCLTLLVSGVLLAGVGCGKKEDPRERPGFIDTSDPGKVNQTMIPPPKGGKDPTSLTGPGKPPGAK